MNELEARIQYKGLGRNHADETAVMGEHQLALTSRVQPQDVAAGFDVDTLYVKEIQINGGPMLKRFRPRAMGRATRILKRTSHITVVVDEA